MKTSIVLSAAAAALLLGGAASAQSVKDPSLTSICLDPGGRTLPVTCRSHDASRVNPREDICQCLHGGEQVEVSFCPAGVTPPAENAKFATARRAAVKHGSLVGATYLGRPICVQSRKQLGGY